MIKPLLYLMVCFVNVHPWRVACNSGKPCLRWLWSQRRCVHVCICACYRVDEIGSTCCFNSFLLKKHLKLFIYFVFIFFFQLTKRFQGLHESLTIQFWIAQLNLWPSQTFIFQVFMILCEISWSAIVHICHASATGHWNSSLNSFIERDVLYLEV